MKLLLQRILVVAALLSGSLIQGYALVDLSDSEVPLVDVYVYKADNEQEAKNKHKSYMKALGIPTQVIEISDKIVGITAPAAAALGAPTAGVSVAVQKGAEITVKGLAELNKLFGEKFSREVVGRIKRGDDSLHENVPRGNRGRFAERADFPKGYAFITLPNSVVALHSDPIRVNKGNIVGFKITGADNPEKPGEKLFTVKSLQPSFNQATGKVTIPPQVAKEYIAADKDTRDRNTIRELAKISGARALAGK